MGPWIFLWGQRTSSTMEQYSYGYKQCTLDTAYKTEVKVFSRHLCIHDQVIGILTNYVMNSAVYLPKRHAIHEWIHFQLSTQTCRENWSCVQRRCDPKTTPGHDEDVCLCHKPVEQVISFTSFRVIIIIKCSMSLLSVFLRKNRRGRTIHR